MHALPVEKGWSKKEEQNDVTYYSASVVKLVPSIPWTERDFEDHGDDFRWCCHRLAAKVKGTSGWVDRILVSDISFGQALGLLSLALYCMYTITTLTETCTAKKKEGEEKGIESLIDDGWRWKKSPKTRKKQEKTKTKKKKRKRKRKEKNKRKTTKGER